MLHGFNSSTRETETKRKERGELDTEEDDLGDVGVKRWMERKGNIYVVFMHEHLKCKKVRKLILNTYCLTEYKKI